MFDIGASELLLIVVVAVIVIGPKDLPLALRTAGRWIGKMRRISGHFRTGLETMIREAELEDLEKKWAEQNAKIMREHPTGTPHELEPTGAYPAQPVAAAPEAAQAAGPASPPPAAAEARVIAAGEPSEYQDMPGRQPAADEQPRP
jgi:sec-independent protein translocase protein TatB